MPPYQTHCQPSGSCCPSQACTSAEQLLPLHRALRRSRAAELGADLACGAVAWLPYDYKLELLGSAALQQKAQASGPVRGGLCWHAASAAAAAVAAAAALSSAQSAKPCTSCASPARDGLSTVQEGLLWMLGPGEGGCGAAAEGEVDAAVLVFAKSNNHNTHNSWLAGAGGADGCTLPCGACAALGKACPAAHAAAPHPCRIPVPSCSPTAGVVAGSPRALASAVLKAVQLQPACCEFYVDRCWDRAAAPPWLAAAAGRPRGGYAEEDGPSHYVLSGKRLP